MNASPSTPTPLAPAALRQTLGQMVDVLQTERRALAGMDLDSILTCSRDKNQLCMVLEGVEPAQVDEECRGLIDAARRLNEVNRQIRNLIAANVAARLEAIAGSARIYRTGGSGPAYAYAGWRS